MTVLTLELSPDAYRRLHEEAARLGKSPQVVAQEWLAERMAQLSAIQYGVQVSGELAGRPGMEAAPPDKGLALEQYSTAIPVVDAPPARPESDRERACQALCAAGLLTDLGPNLRRLANPMVRLESVRAALGRAGGKTLSEIVLEQRGLEG